MHHWIYENMFIFILASVSGVDLLKRISVRVYSAVTGFPLKCYLKFVASFARGKRDELCSCGD